MKITVVSLNRFTSPSGVCVSVCNYIRCLEQLNDIESIQLVIGAWQEHYYINTLKILENRKVKIVPISITNNSFNRNKWFFSGLKTIANKTDLLVMGYPIPAFGLKVPAITILHDLYAFDYPTNFGFPNVFFNQFIFGLNMLITNSYWCVSEFTMLSLLRRFSWLVKRKIVAQIYNFVPSQELVGTDRPFIFHYWLSVAQHRKNKNLDLVIKAFYAYISDNRDLNELKLIIVGSNGPETHHLENLISNFKLKDQVIFLSNISNDALKQMYKYSSLTINASSIEGFGLPLVEACYHGGKVIASDIPVYHELVDDVLTFSLEGDAVKNLSVAIEAALTSPFRVPILNKELSDRVIEKKIEVLIKETVAMWVR